MFGQNIKSCQQYVLAIVVVAAVSCIFVVKPASGTSTCAGVSIEGPNCGMGMEKLNGSACLTEENNLLKDGNFSQGLDAWTESSRADVTTSDNGVVVQSGASLYQIVEYPCSGLYVFTYEVRGNGIIVCLDSSRVFDTSSCTRWSSGETPLPTTGDWFLLQCAVEADVTKPTMIPVIIEVGEGGSGDISSLEIRYAHLLMIPSGVCPIPGQTATPTRTSTATGTTSGSSTFAPTHTGTSLPTTSLNIPPIASASPTISSAVASSTSSKVPTLGSGNATSMAAAVGAPTHTGSSLPITNLSIAPTASVSPTISSSLASSTSSNVPMPSGVQSPTYSGNTISTAAAAPTAKDRSPTAPSAASLVHLPVQFVKRSVQSKRNRQSSNPDRENASG
eukprot:gb/GECG01013750.1/.p1 GENE.gb/GECG01013750.1/~~gb/GECG01013750.1/.p1  ORF type:complete len:391 (+),score=38.76 gb/GECG01013750.1/:1-1173(+)